MLFIQTIYDCNISLYYKSVNQYFCIPLQDCPNLSDEEKNNICISGYYNIVKSKQPIIKKRIHIFLKDIIYFDFGDSSTIDNNYLHNNMYKSILKTDKYSINDIKFFHKDYITSFLSYNFTKNRINGHIYLKWIFLKKCNNKICFNGKILYPTICFPNHYFFKNIILFSIEKVENTEIYEIFSENGLQFFTKKIYKSNNCKELLKFVDSYNVQINNFFNAIPINY